MKLLFTLLGFSLLGLYAQTVVLNDQFDADNGTFVVKQTSNYKSEIKNGFFIMDIKDASQGYWFYNKTGLDTEKENFTVECTMELQKGPKSTYYGLAIAIYNDASNYVNFYINNEGYFIVNHYYNDEIHNNASKQYTSAIKSSGPQVLKVERKFNVCSYYINGIKVHENANRSYYGSGFGVQVSGKGVVTVDDFKVTSSVKDYNLVENAIIGRKKENLGPNINSDYEEMAPVVSADGKTLFFIRADSPDNIGGKNQDIWYSILDANGNWGPAKNIGRPLNNNGHNFMVNITPDNQKIFVNNIYGADGEFDRQGLSYSTRVGNNWSKPTGINIRNFENLNDYVDYFPDLGNKFIILSIETKGTLGEKDFFISFIQSDGSYSTPLHMGNVINSVGDEWGPVLAADGKTLYFCSNGHTSYGSTDVFVSKRLDDTWTNWSIPKNLGPEINTDEFDGQIFISADGKYGYISSEFGVDNGISDIFRFELSSEKPEPVVLIYGKVLNSKTKEPLSASITYDDLNTNENMGIAQSASNDGSYKIILPMGKAYSFLAQKEGYYPISENIDVTNITEYTEIERNLYLSPVDVGTVIRLNNVFFEFDKADLKSESQTELNRLVNFMQTNPSVEIQISGHTDDKGSDSYNQTLSQNRVNTVVAYLIDKGIDKSRLKGVGYGESKPIADNKTEEGRAQNRRVEFTIMKK